VSRYFYFFRLIIIHFLRQHLPLIQLQGPVEIDEMRLQPHRRTENGRLPAPGQIIFGLYSRTTKRTILYHVPDRSRNTLIPIILDHVFLGAITYSDMFMPYINSVTLQSFLQQIGYQHLFEGLRRSRPTYHPYKQHQKAMALSEELNFCC